MSDIDMTEEDKMSNQKYFMMSNEELLPIVKKALSDWKASEQKIYDNLSTSETLPPFTKECELHINKLIQMIDDLKSYNLCGAKNELKKYQNQLLDNGNYTNCLRIQKLSDAIKGF